MLEYDPKTEKVTTRPSRQRPSVWLTVGVPMIVSLIAYAVLWSGRPQPVVINLAPPSSAEFQRTVAASKTSLAEFETRQAVYASPSP